VWEATSGRELFTLSGHTREVYSIAFSPDGTRLATASWDRTARVWEAASGRKLLTLSGHTREVYGIAFSPNGTRLATAGADKTVRLYVLDIQDLMALARRRVTRSLTSEECQLYLRDQCPPTP
jgi:WD40 repeat protein